MNLNLPLAVFWLVLGVAMLLWHASTPDALGRNILGTGLSAGWLCLLLGLYNLVRWWSIRSYAIRQRQFREEANALRRREGPSRPVQEPDPNFNFTDPPTPPAPGPEGGRRE
jgi:hypothetical protein